MLSKKFSNKHVLDFFKEKYLKNLEAIYNWFVFNDKKSVFVPVGTPTNSDKLLYILSCLNAKWDLDFFVRVDATMYQQEIVEQAKTGLPSIYLSGTDLNTITYKFRLTQKKLHTKTDAIYSIYGRNGINPWHVFFNSHLGLLNNPLSYVTLNLYRNHYNGV